MKKETTKQEEGIRLNKFIANAGICSRRKADEHIQDGDVKVNNEVILEMGYKVKLKDKVYFKGTLVKSVSRPVYILLNKPKDHITTTQDERGRKTVLDLIKGATQQRVYPCGRLDRNTTGLLLLTNDGELTEKLTHPRFNVKKIYSVSLSKQLRQDHFERIQEGLELEDGFIQVDDIAYIEGKSKKDVGVELHSGKNRIVRRIFEHLGYEVTRLDRVMYAGLTKKNLPRGKWRYLSQKEVIALKHFQSPK